MALEHEIDRMVVRLVGNQEDYQKMLKDVEKQTEESAKWAEEQGSKISQAFSKAFKTAQGMISSVGSTTQKIGMASGAAGGAVSAPMAKAALDFSEYGKSIRDLVYQSEEAAKKAEFLKKRVMANTEAYKELAKVIKLTEKQASVFKVMSDRTGISVHELSKTIKTNSAEFETWRKEAEKLGLVMGKEAVKSANDLAESWVKLKQSLSGMWSQLGSVVAGNLKSLNELIIGITTWTIKWIRENKELISTVAGVAQKLVYVGAVLTAVGTAITTISTFLGPLVALVTAGAAAWLAWDTATGKFLQGSAIDLWDQYIGKISDVVSKVMEYGRQIVDHVDSTMRGVFDAVKAGNLELAVEILWAGVKVAWITALSELDRITGEMFSGIFQSLAAGDFKGAMQAAFNEILIVWNKLLLAIEPIFVQITNQANTAWNSIVNALDTAGVRIQNVLGSIQAWFLDVVDNVRAAWAGLMGFFEALGKFIKGVWESTLGGIFGMVSFFTTRVIGVFKSITDSLGLALKGVAGGLAAQLSLTTSVAIEAFKTAIGATVDTSGFTTGLAAAGMAAETAFEYTHEDRPEGTTHRKIAAGEVAKRERDLEGRVTDRTAQTTIDNTERLIQSAQNVMKYQSEIAKLEEEIAAIAERSKESADQKLAAEKEALEVAKAKAEAQLAEARNAEAKAEKTRALDLAERTMLEEKVRIERDRQGITERHDPIQKYMRQLKELNALFEESERSGEVYRRAIEEIELELGEGMFKFNVEFGVTGMDAVRSATREHQQLIEAGLETLAKRRGQEQALADAARREREIERKEVERAAREGAKAPIPWWEGPEFGPKEGAAPGETSVASREIPLLDRIAAACEKTAEKLDIPTEPLGLGIA